MTLRPLDVIVIFDHTIRPPGPKMVAAILPELGFFYRINTRPWRPAVRLVKEPDHPWLDHDSWLECGDPLEIDDHIVAESLGRNGIVGRLNLSIRGEVKRYLIGSRFVSAADKALVCRMLDDLAG